MGYDFATRKDQFERRYKEAENIIGTDDELNEFIQVGTSLDLTSALELSSYIIDNQQQASDVYVKFNAYQDILKVLKYYNTEEMIDYLRFAQIPASRIDGILQASQIDYINVSQIDNFNPTIYASDILGQFKTEQINKLDASQIIDYNPIIYVSDIVDKVDASQINNIYASQINGLISSEQIEYLKKSDVIDMDSYLQASRISGQLQTSQISSTITSSISDNNLGEIDYSYFVVGQYDLNNPPHKAGIYACNTGEDTSGITIVPIFGSDDGVEQLQAMVKCSLWANYRSSFNPTLYYTSSSDVSSCYFKTFISSADAFNNCLAIINGVNPCNTEFANLCT